MICTAPHTLSLSLLAASRPAYKPPPKIAKTNKGKGRAIPEADETTPTGTEENRREDSEHNTDIEMHGTDEAEVQPPFQTLVDSLDIIFTPAPGATSVNFGDPCTRVYPPTILV